MKLPPSPSESASIVPEWFPDFEPVTVIVPNSLVGMPRIVICVCGVATRSLGVGKTVTVVALAAAGASSASALANGSAAATGAQRRVIQDIMRGPRVCIRVGGHACAAGVRSLEQPERGDDAVSAGRLDVDLTRS